MIKKAFLISELLIVFLFISCQQTDQDPTCQIGFCENNGTLIDCACECPQGFTGLNCEKIDFTQTQKLLDNGITPFELISSGVKLDSIYGKIYKDGHIFELNIVDKIVKITTKKDLEENLQWTNAVNYCDNLEINNSLDWYLPNLDEVLEIREILYLKLKLGDFEDDYYWTSNTLDNNPNDAYGVFFLNGNIGPIEKDRMNDVSYNFVRAVRQIQL